jgi:hypothetical protein
MEGEVGETRLESQINSRVYCQDKKAMTHVSTDRDIKIKKNNVTSSAL